MEIISSRTRLAIALAVPMFNRAEAQASFVPVRVVIENVHGGEGVLLIQLCDEDGYNRRTRCQSARVQARRGTVEHVFAQVPPRDHAVLVIHDANANGRLDFHWYGPPREATGASNNPRPRMGPPLFDSARFTVAASPLSVSIRLQGGN